MGNLSSFVFAVALTAALVARADELPSPNQPVTDLNHDTGYFLNPQAWTFLGHLASGADTVSVQLDTGPGASYFQDGHSHAARAEIDVTRPFCKLIILSNMPGAHAPGAPIELRRDAHLVLRDHGVRTQSVAGPAGASGGPPWVQTVIPFDTEASSNDDPPNLTGEGFPELWGLDCRSPGTLTIQTLQNLLGLHVYHKGWNPYHLIAAADPERTGPKAVPEPAAQQPVGAATSSSSRQRAQ